MATYQLSQVWTTFYALVGGNEPLDLDVFESSYGPWLAVYFKAYDHAVINVQTPAWRGIDDGSGVLAGFDVSSGVLSGHVSSQEPWPYLTGVVWNLFNKSIPPDLGSARTSMRAEPRQTLRDSGFVVLQDALEPYSTLGPSVAYYGWPLVPTPPSAPSSGSAAPVSKGGALAWGIIFATALTALAQGKVK